MRNLTENVIFCIFFLLQVSLRGFLVALQIGDKNLKILGGYFEGTERKKVT